MKSFPGTVMLANRHKDKEVRLERESAKRLERERERECDKRRPWF